MLVKPLFNDLLDKFNEELVLLAKKSVEKWDGLLVYDAPTVTAKEPEDEPRK